MPDHLGHQANRLSTPGQDHQFLLRQLGGHGNCWKDRHPHANQRTLFNRFDTLKFQHGGWLDSGLAQLVLELRAIATTCLGHQQGFSLQIRGQDG